jgi:hypothetical protein
MYVLETPDCFRLTRSVSSGSSFDFCLSPGWVGPLTRFTLRGILLRVQGFRTQNFLWKVRFDHGPLAAGLKSLGLPFRLQPIHVLQLDPDHARAFAGYNATIRNQIRKAHRRGVVIRDTHSPDDVVAYHRMYLRLAKEKGWGSLYPVELTLNLLKLSDLTRFLVAEYAGRVIAGGMFLRDGCSVYYLHGVYDRDYSHLFPSCPVIDQGIHWACESGASFFNFGNSGENSSLAQFKSFWGARPVSNWLFEWQNPFLAVVSRFQGVAKGMVAGLSQVAKRFRKRAYEC